MDRDEKINLPQAAENDPLLAEHQQVNRAKINTIDNPEIFLAVTEGITFFQGKGLLTQELFDFLIDNEEVTQIVSLFRWLDKLAAKPTEILSFVGQLRGMKNIGILMNRLQELTSQHVIDIQISFAFFSATLDLIDSDMGEVKYIQQLKQTEHPFLLVNAFKLLRQHSLLEDTYFDFVTSGEEHALLFTKVELLVKLKKNNLLNPKNLHSCRLHPYLVLLNELLTRIENKNFNLEKVFPVLVNKAAYHVLIYLNYLEKYGWLAERRLTVLKSLHNNQLINLVNIIFLAEGFVSVAALDFLTHAKGDRFRKLYNALQLLKNEKFLTQANFDLILVNAHIPDVVYQFAQALVVLKNNQLNTSSLLQETSVAAEPLLFAFALAEMNKAQILSNANLMDLKHVKSPSYFFKLLRLLNRFEALNEVNFKNLLKLDADLFGSAVYREISRLRVSSTEFLVELFAIIFSEDLSAVSKKLAIEQLLRNKPLRTPAVPVNPAQSIHFTSVHRSVSQSALRFLAEYQQSVQDDVLETRFQEIADELLHQSITDSLQQQAVRSALQRIAESDFVDPVSKLGLKKLLVLLWVGVHDETKRISSLEDAKKQLIKALYEIQRIGNIDNYGQDNGLPDASICCSGAFIKLIEKMLAIHAFVELIIITPELAAIKFPVVVKVAVEDYLLSLDSEKVVLQHDLLKLRGVSVIWEHIAAEVREKMLAEFAPLYQDDSGNIHGSFEQLMATHTDLEIDPMLMSSINSADAMNKLQLSTTSLAVSECGESSGLNQRTRRDCLDRRGKKGKAYSPFKAQDPKFQYLLVFLMGWKQGQAIKQVLEKLELFQQIARSAARNHGELGYHADLIQAVQPDLLWRQAEAMLTETFLFRTKLIELSNEEGKKSYLAVNSETKNEKLVYTVYCAEINKEAFLSFDSGMDLTGIATLYGQLLYPAATSSEVTVRYLDINQEKPFHALSVIDNLLTNVAIHPAGQDLLTVVSDKDRVIEGLPIEVFSRYFFINGYKIDDSSRLSQDIFTDPDRQLSFRLEKIAELLWELPVQQQIALGKLLDKYNIAIDRTQINEMPDMTVERLMGFRETLLEKLTSYANQDQVITETELNEISSLQLSRELADSGFTAEEVTRLLEETTQSHHQARIGLSKIIAASRQGVILAPPLLQALNGHADNLTHLSGLMAADISLGKSYLYLINHPRFTQRFPKIASSLRKGAHALVSPVAKILVLKSFFDLSRQLAETPIGSAEHDEASALLLDNSIIFGSMLVEALGLELGPAGLILDLGITIHQLLISANYLRRHYHLQVSWWEGIKFELGFASKVQEILTEREVLDLSLIEINRISQLTSVYFKNMTLRVPSLEEKNSVYLKLTAAPSRVFNRISSNPKLSFLTFQYKYGRQPWRGLAGTPTFPFRTLRKRQYAINSAGESLTINFSPINQALYQENNVFLQSEQQCESSLELISPSPFTKDECQLENYRPFPGPFPGPFPASYQRGACYSEKCFTKPIITEGWRVAVSNRLIGDDTEGRKQSFSQAIIGGSLAGLMLNHQPALATQAQLDMLIVFNPHYGNMLVIEGSSLSNQRVCALIQDPPFADVLIADDYVPASFHFFGRGYNSTLYYWVGQNTVSSIIRDNFAKIYVRVLPIAAGYAKQTVRMLTSDQLSFGEQGPQFLGLNNKREITFEFSQGYFLSGDFQFTSSLISLKQVRAKWAVNQRAYFYLSAAQLCEMKEIAGALVFSSKDEDTQYEIVVNTHPGLQVILNKQAGVAYSFESNLALNYFSTLSYLPQTVDNQTTLLTVWQKEQDVALKIRATARGYLDLSFKGRYEIGGKNYTASFAFQAKNPVCSFVNLSVHYLLISNLASFRSLLSKGFSCFSFYDANERSYEQLEYDASEVTLVYKGIAYRFNDEHNLVAYRGVKIAAGIESFRYRLADISLDLRGNFLPIRIDQETLRLGHRLLVNVTGTTLLLTNAGSQYMGLLVISSMDTPSSALKISPYSIEEKGYIADSQQSLPAGNVVWKPWLISGIVLGGAAVLVTPLIRMFYRLHRRGPPAALEMLATAGVVVPWLARMAQAGVTENKPLLHDQEKSEKESDVREFMHASMNHLKLQAKLKKGSKDLPPTQLMDRDKAWDREEQYYAKYAVKKHQAVKPKHQVKHASKLEKSKQLELVTGQKLNRANPKPKFKSLTGLKKSIKTVNYTDKQSIQENSQYTQRVFSLHCSKKVNSATSADLFKQARQNINLNHKTKQIAHAVPLKPKSFYTQATVFPMQPRLNKGLKSINSGHHQQAASSLACVTAKLEIHNTLFAFDVLMRRLSGNKNRPPLNPKMLQAQKKIERYQEKIGKFHR